MSSTETAAAAAPVDVDMLVKELNLAINTVGAVAGAIKAANTDGTDGLDMVLFRHVQDSIFAVMEYLERVVEVELRGRVVNLLPHPADVGGAA